MKKRFQTRGSIEIMDTTLRDGEQTSGVSFTPTEKLSIARNLLSELKIPRIEIASARISSGEFNSTKSICEWAEKSNYINSLEILGFIDDGQSVNWVKKVGCKVINLLAKGSERHCLSQLQKTPQDHLDDIKREIEYAQKNGLTVNLYLEDWSNGIKYSPEYVYFLIDNLKDMGIKRFMLPDTLGVLNPNQVYGYGKRMTDTYPDLHFDFHGHNDYDLATSNSFAAGLVGFKGIHCTINGLGERAGNTPLSSVIAIMHDMLHLKTGINEKKINKVSRLVESFSGITIPPNRPIIGDNVFTQCAGVHADGDRKANLYFNDLLPERFGREREYALGKTSGHANIIKNLDSLGIVLDEDDIQKVTQRVIQLGDKKEIVTQSDLPYIVSDILKHNIVHNHVEIINYGLSLTKNLQPTATIRIRINNKEYSQSANGDGQYDAFVKAIKEIYRHQLKREFPLLTNYTVNIPPGGKTDALVQTTISWEYHGRHFKTSGLDADQVESAILATEKMLNIVEKIDND